MSRSVNQVTLLGNLARDGETTFTPSGVAKTSLTVVTNRRWKDASGEWKDEADFCNVVLWRMENLTNFLLKGKQVYVQGRLSNRSYEKDGIKKYISEVVAETIILLGGGERQADASSTPTPNRTRPAELVSEDLGVSQDDIDELPF